MELSIDANEAQIEAWEATDCDFTVIYDEFVDKWADLEEDHEAQKAAIADWKEDGYELENAVD